MPEDNLCPHCNSPLRRETTRFGFVFSCAACHGVMTGIPFLRKAGYSAEHITEIWTAARENSVESKRKCPYCGKLLRQIEITGVGGPLELDVCRDCQQIWFDCGEQSQLIQNQEPEEALKPAPYKVDQERIERAIREENNAPANHRNYYNIIDGDDDAPRMSSANTMLASLGLPTEYEVDGNPVGVPWLTGLLALGLLGGNIWLAYNKTLDRVSHEYGLIPADCMRHNGLDWLTGLFLQDNMFFLIIGIFFLVTLGPKVESVLGRFKFLLLLLLSGFFGEFVWVLLNHASTQPMVGITSGLMGIAAYYAISFPNNCFCWRNVRDNYGFPDFEEGGWSHIPIWIALVIFIIIEIVVYWYLDWVRHGIPAPAHFGGLVPGIILAIWTRCRRSPDDVNTEAQEQ